MKIRPRRLPLRAHLLGFGLACFIPASIALGYLGLSLADAEQHRVALQHQDITRDLKEGVGRALEAPARVLSALAGSPSMAATDWASFQRQAETVADANGVAIALRNLDRRQLVNTVVHFGSRQLPVTTDPILWAADDRAIESRRPAVSDLYFGAAGKRYFVSIVVPVMVDGAVAYLLTMAIPPDRLLSPSTLGKLADQGWLATLVGADGRVVARTRDQERFQGARMTEPLLQAVREGPSGEMRSTTLDGDAVQTRYVRAAYDWTVVVSVPERVLNGPVKALVAILGVVFALVIASTGAAAWAYGRLLGRELGALSENAVRMGGQRPLVRPHTYVAEVDRIHGAMDAANKRIEVLVSELDHRVKNTLAIVLSVVARSVGDRKERTVIEGRVAALSRAHEALSASRWEGSDLCELLTSVAKTYDLSVECDGPKIMLTPKAVVSLAQVFQELLSNAREHGALRFEHGAVSVVWHVDDGQLWLKWIEAARDTKSGEKTFEPGFGLKIVELCIGRQLAGDHSVHVGNYGWTLALRFPLVSELGIAARQCQENPDCRSSPLV